MKNHDNTAILDRPAFAINEIHDFPELEQLPPLSMESLLLNAPAGRTTLLQDGAFPACRPLLPATAAPASNNIWEHDPMPAAEDFMPMLAGLSRNMIFVKNEAFQIVYANQAFLDIYPPEQRSGIIGTTTVENWAETEARVFLAEDRKAFEDGYAELTEELTDYTGKTRHLKTQKTRFEMADGRRYIMGVCVDITQLVEREKEMAKATLALENFAALAAHDLRSPLGAIISGLDLIQLDDQNDVSESSLHVLTMMRHTAEGLMGQIATLLSTYKASQAGTMAVGPVDFGALVAEVKFNLGGMLTQTGGKVLMGSIPPVRAERHLLRQVVHNLVENSLKYRSAEAPVIIIRHTDLDNHHLFTVDDNGIGIRNDAAEKSFELYEQPEGAVGGFGIGLTLCKKIVESHGGEIWIQPNVEGGCRVCFTIAKTI